MIPHGGALLLGNTKSSWKTSACLAAFSNGVMGNLAIVLLLVCTVSSCVARPGISLFPDGYNPVSSSDGAVPKNYHFPGFGWNSRCDTSDNLGQPCEIKAECCYELVCKSGSCQRP
ncbi:hypothetical protein ISCGN_027238 [Ixodes scapularis]